MCYPDIGITHTKALSGAPPFQPAARRSSTSAGVSTFVDVPKWDAIAGAVASPRTGPDVDVSTGELIPALDKAGARRGAVPFPTPPDGSVRA